MVVYPTDSSYALGCLIGDKEAMERIRRIRDVDVKNHNFTLVCRDLSEIAKYARVDNSQYRTLKAFTPGPYTFLLEATREVPKRLQNPKRRTIGIRVPDNAIVQHAAGRAGRADHELDAAAAGRDHDARPTRRRSRSGSTTRSTS